MAESNGIQIPATPWSLLRGGHSSGAIIGSRFVTLLNEKEGDAEKAIRQLKEDLKQ